MAVALPTYDNLDLQWVDGGVLVLTLDRPAARNAITRAMHDELVNVLAVMRTLKDLGAVVITGAGKAFCAGGDLEMIEGFNDDWAEGIRLADDGQALVRNFLSVRAPVIAAVNGHAMGLGATLALLSDLVVMADDALLADNHVKVGIVPGDGGTALWPARVGLARAKEYLLTGDPITAAEADRIGLVNRVVPRDEVVPTAMELAQRMARGPRHAIAWAKQALNVPLVRECAYQLPMAMSFEGQSLVQPDVVEGLAAVAERRDPDWPSAAIR